MSIMQSLPEVVWQNVALNLSAKDILSFLCVSRRMHGLGKSETFWKLLLKRDEVQPFWGPSSPSAELDCVRRAFMVNAYKNCLSSVTWYPIRTTHTAEISSREGHLACVLKGPSPSQRRIVVHGGFSEDEAVHVINVGHVGNSDSWSLESLHPAHNASYVYGASLTPLVPSSAGGPNSDGNTARAVRFGGFRSGGYSDETMQVSILTLQDERTESGDQRLTADWQIVEPQNAHLGTPRAYHSATLVGGRYLVLIGGMTSRESILNEAVLDTETWTYVDRTIGIGDEKPSGRHGHSIVLDSKRNRLVLFGGGSGTDLLRSGADNAEVWELRFGACWQENLEDSLPWTWNKLHGTVDTEANGNDEDENEDDDDMDDSNQLSPAERLCLGRCHQGVKVSTDQVLLLFGSGRPSTNGMIGYSLETNSFVRPAVNGPLPKPRFTGIASLLEEDGYIFFHGGFCAQQSDTIGDMDVLDLAPGLGRNFNGMPVDTRRISYEATTDAHAFNARRHPVLAVFPMFATLMQATGDERRRMAAEMLSQTRNGEIAFQDGSLLLLNMIASGIPMPGDSDEAEEVYDGMEDSDDDDDSDYQDG